MPTLQDVTLAHSRRLSNIYKARAVQAADAVLSRDLQLRALKSTTKAYAQFDEDTASAREKRAATEQKAAAGRAAALDRAIESRGEGLAGRHSPPSPSRPVAWKATSSTGSGASWIRSNPRDRVIRDLVIW
ncbi:MAG: hypothetical protein Q7R30_05285 [Acidobacteriota bacterium]|nr:hypothetical protein [Acidobacteriota bacterium]